MRLCLLTFWVASPVQAHSLGPDFVALSAAVLPTTVHIRVERGPLVAAGIQQMARDFSIPSQGHTQGQVVLSSGSGVILSASGTVLTNHHVINGAQAIVITTYDQRRYQATVVGADPRTDIAVLQIQGDGPFDAANFEAGAPLAVGAWVVAVGHPFDFPFTVTAGIVSALGRRGLGHNEIQDYIQTDVAVNPGSSGGPLFDVEGRVVGINTAIFSPDKENLASAGISFAIPVGMAIDIGTKLANGEAVTRATVGLSVVDQPASSAEPRQGARISRVLAGSDAEKAGLRRSDVIFSVDGEPIPSATHFRRLIQSRDIGIKLRLGIGRAGRDRLIWVKTEAASTMGETGPNRAPQAVLWGGLSLENVDPKELEKRGIALPSSVVGGVLVTAVAPDSPAAVAGLLVGDVLLEIRSLPILGVDELLATVENHRVVLISFWRGYNRYLAALANPVQPD
jgi:serine protease Do